MSSCKNCSEATGLGWGGGGGGGVGVLSSFSDHLHCEINQPQLASTDATSLSKFSTIKILKSSSFHIEESILAT